MSYKKFKKDDSNDNSKFCKECEGKGYIGKSTTLSTCPKCISTDDLMDVLLQVLQNHWSKKQWDNYNRLQSVYSLLPDSPFFAIMEAEYQGLTQLIPLIKNHFQILPLK